MTLCEKILCVYNLKAKTRSKNFVQKCQIIIDGKSAERIYVKNIKNNAPDANRLLRWRKTYMAQYTYKVSEIMYAFSKKFFNLKLIIAGGKCQSNKYF